MTNQQADERKFAYPIGVLYVVAAALVILHPADVMLGVFPIRLGDLAWRAGTIGALSGALMFPLLGFVLASVVAYLLNHKWVQVLLTVVYTLLVIALVTGMVVFTFDMIQLRPQVKPEFKQSYDFASVKGMFSLAALTLVYFALALASFKQTRSMAKRSARARLDAPTTAVFSAPAKP